jgi:heat shock protein HslJ
MPAYWENDMKSRLNDTAVFAATFFLLLALLAACGQAQPSSPGGGASLPGSALEGTMWTMTSLAGSEPLQGSEITAGFLDGEMSGSTGCNIYFYAYRAEEQRLILEGGGVTEMACSQPQGVMEQETRFLDALNQVDQFFLTENSLQLTTRQGDQLIFVPRP